MRRIETKSLTQNQVVKRTKVAKWGGCFRVSASDDLESIINDIRPDLMELGINISYKRIQLPDTYTPLSIMGSSNAFCDAGLKSKLMHHMKVAEEELLKNGKASTEYYDVPLPLCKWYLKYFWEGKLPTQVYQKYGIKNNFKLPDAAFRLLHFECALEDSPRLFQVLQYMQASGLIRHIYGIKSRMIELLQGQMSEAWSIKYQQNCHHHIAYNLKVQSLSHDSIGTLDKKVEVRIRDGEEVTYEGGRFVKHRRFTTLRDEYLSLG